MPRPPRHPLFWLVSFLLWMLTLWVLSSRTGDETQLPPIPMADKVAHFGFFLGGSGLLCAFLYCLGPLRSRWKLLFLVVMVVMGSIGWLDEIHQSYTPGRFGKDPYDWLADVTGGLAGCLIFRRMHTLLHPRENKNG